MVDPWGIFFFLILISHKLVSIDRVDIFPKTFNVIHPMDFELTNLSSTH